MSKEEFRPDPGNVEAISKMNPPTNIREVRKFLGMCGFYHKHIDNFSSVASPLTNLARKDQPFEWSESCQHAFEGLKQRSMSAPILVKANLTRHFILETDAS